MPERLDDVAAGDGAVPDSGGTTAPPAGDTDSGATTTQGGDSDDGAAFAAGAVHDINNLLGALLTYTELVTADIAGAMEHGERVDLGRVREDIRRIHRTAERAGALTERILTAGQDAGTPPARDLNSMTRTAADVLLGGVVGEKVTVDAAALGTELWPVRIDPGEFERVLVNLVANAVQAMPDGGTVRIETSNVTTGPNGDWDEDEPAPPNRFVRLRISDSGTGMPADVAARAFEPYFTTRANGTGLGLATVHRIVTAARGYVTIDSTSGRGTAINVLLPAAL